MGGFQKRIRILLVVTISLLLQVCSALGAVDRVICVPWQGDPLKYHTAISGEVVLLKGVIQTTDTGEIWYKWVHGDNSESAPVSLSGSLSYNVQGSHVYTGAVGTPFSARLVVAGDSAFLSENAEDEYRIRIFDDNLDARINLAIDAGLWWLFKNRSVSSDYKTFDGSSSMVWNQWSHQNCYASPTASAIQAFAINNHKIKGDPDEDPYVEAVQKGINWLVQGYWRTTAYPMLRTWNISNQNGYLTDANGNGVGIEVRDRGYKPVYQGGQIMDAIIASGVDPDEDTGRNFTGRTQAQGGNWTFGELLQDMCDMYAYGQEDPGNNYRGGWQYDWNVNSDNSAAQWAAVGMIPAQEPPWNCVVPDWVKSENAVWLNYSYNSGHFGYTSANYQHDWYHNTTPSGMVQMAMDGQVGVDDPDTAGDQRDPKWIACERYIADNWYRFLHSDSYSWRDGMLSYGWYAFAKAMRLSVPQAVERITATDGTRFDWYTGTGSNKGLAQRIVETQWGYNAPQNIHHPAYGQWDGSLTDPPLTTAWMVIVLKPALFAASPIACFTAKPNPTYSDKPVTLDPSCSGHTETGKDIHNLVQFDWDFDNDGRVDKTTLVPETVSRSFSCASVPCEYPVTLKVTDDQGLKAAYTLNVNITDPPHPPVADAGGPYIVSLSDLDRLVLDGSGSVELDEGKKQDGCDDCEPDRIQAWEWDLTDPLTDFTDAAGEVVTLSGSSLASWLTPGETTLALKVRDNTGAAFPDSGQPDLTDVDFGTIQVFGPGIRDLNARPKETKCQLTWTHIGAGAYKILRSTTGPNTGFEQIGTTTSTYSTFLDYNLTGEVQVENTCKGDLDHNETVDQNDASLFTPAIGTWKTDPGYLADGDFDEDGDVDGRDVAYFAAEFGRTECMQETGIELNTDYWYRVQADMGGQTILSIPAFVRSTGRITNQPPVFSSDPVTNAGDGIFYAYEVQAHDPEGGNVVFSLDTAPEGMAIDPVSGRITWTPESTQTGPNDVMVRVADMNGMVSTQFFTVFVTAGINTAPAVNAGGPYAGLVGEAIFFDGSATMDPDGDDLVAYHWIFGDGTEGFGEQVSHTYAGAGIYTITLHVRDSRGRTGHGTARCEAGNPNRPPVAFISGPAMADAGTQVSFSGSSSYDPDGDALTFAWDLGDGMTAAGAEVTRSFFDPGVYRVFLTVEDGRGGSDTASFPFTVGPPNTPPVFENPPYLLTGDLFNSLPLTFTAQASDPDSDYLSYVWDFGDGTMGQGNPLEHVYDSPGAYTVTLTVDDGRGGVIFEQRILNIAQISNRPPVAQANGPYAGDLADGSPAEVLLSASGSSDPDGDDLRYRWTVNGTDYFGQSVTVPFDRVGQHEVILTVTETGTLDLFSHAAVALVLIRDSNDVTPPTAVITTPDTSASTITQKMDVLGTVSDTEHFAGFVLEISGDRDSDGSWINWVTLNEGTEPVIDGVLGTLDPSAVKNDFYRLRVRAWDGTQETSHWIEVKLAGELKFGNLKMSFNDLNIPLAGLPITITRTYDSFDKSRGDFGHGWTLDINKAQIKEDINHNVFITLPDGRRVAFGFAPVRLSPWFPGWDVRFVAPPGVHAELDFAGDHYVNQSADGDWYWFSGLFDPDEYILKTKDGRTYEISQPDGIRKVTDRNGNSLTINDEGIIHSSGKSIAFDRDAQGRIQRITDPSGNHIDYTYDAKGDLTRVTYPEGYVMAFSYNDDHLITQMIDPEGRAVQQNEYDAAGRLVATVNDEGARTQFIHDVDTKTETAIDAGGNISLARFNDQGLKTEEVDQEGNRKIWAYDEDQNIIGHEIRDPQGHLLRSMGMAYDDRGNPVKIILPDGGEYVNTFNEGNRMTSTTLPDGKSQTYDYDQDYNLIRVSNSLGHVTEYTYDTNGNRTSVKDPEGRITHYAYDDYGHLVQVIDPCGRQHVYTRDDRGNTLTYTRPDGAVYVHEYDSMGRKIQVKDPLGNARTFAYDGRGNTVAEVNENGYRTVFEYNSKDKLTRVLYPDGSLASLAYDAVGNMTAMIDPDGFQWTYEYDGAGRKTAQIDPVGNRTDFELDADGEIIAVTDPSGNRTEYHRDALGRIVQVNDAQGGTTRYTYDTAGNITHLEDARGHVRQFVYADWYRLVQEIQPDGTSTRYEYDLAGNRTSRTDAMGRTTQYIYDDCNRLVSRQYPDGTAVELDYDSLDNRIAMTDPLGQTSYAYDLLNRLTRTQRPDGQMISYGYDNVGNLVSITDPLGTTTKTYDILNRLKSVADRAGRVTAYEYGPRGSLASMVYPNGIQADYTWDGAGRMTAIDYTDTRGSVHESTAYTYDPSGNVLSRIFASGESDTFEYDALSRLIRETRGHGEVIETTYDRVGNRLSRSSSTGGIDNHSYNILDQLLTRTYDLNGNLIQQGMFEYEYDFENRLTAITSAGTLLAEYEYDGDGNLVYKTVGATTTGYLVDTSYKYPVVRVENDMASGISTAYTYGHSLISMDKGGTSLHFFMHDSLGSTVGLFDPAGTVTDTYRYDGFGNLTSRTGTTENSFLFTGNRLNDESGLYFMRARHYDPQMGTFLGRDPAMGSAPYPMTFHPYLYANANPLLYVDPLGTQAIMNYSVTIVNNPLQWFGAFMGGMGAGYTVNALGFVTEVLKSPGRPLGEIIANGVIGMMKNLMFLDCGQFAATNATKSGLVNAGLGLAHELMFIVGNNASEGRYGFQDGQIKTALTNFAVNVGRHYLSSAFSMLPQIADPENVAPMSGTFKAFDIGKIVGSALAIYHITAGLAGVL